MFKFVLQKPGSDLIEIALAFQKYGISAKESAGRHTIVHDRTRLLRHTHIPGLLFEFAHRALLDCLTSIKETGGDFDDDLINWRSVLLLQEEFWACGLVENCDDSHAIDLAASGSGL